MQHLARVLVVALAVALLPAAPATAAACPPSGGASIPAAEPTRGDFMVSGRGWGHGVGMSQYGAEGAARLGCSASDILTTYYPGTAVGSASLPKNIRVNLATSRSTVPVEALSGDVPWYRCTGSSCTAIGTQRPGRTWTVTMNANGSYRVAEGSATVWQGGDASSRVIARLSGLRTARVRVATSYRYRYGNIEFQTAPGAAGAPYTTNELAFESYLYGLSEVPSSWPAAALQAQAITGRSYALKRAQSYGGNRPGCRCDVLATVADQHFTGYEKQAAPSGDRWVAAVDATAGRVLRYGSAIADTFYSSSHGGYSESSRFVWGGSVPYLQPVDDTRWEQASSNPAGNQTWARTFSAEQLGAALGVGRALRVETPQPKGHGGRIGDPARGAGGVVVTGTSGTKTVSGDAFRRALGMKSTLFTVEAGNPEPTWSGWGVQPGSGLSAPGVVSWAAGRSDVFAVDGAGRLVHRWLISGQGWGPGGSWRVLGHPSGVRLVGQPTAVSQQAGSLDVFVRGADDALWQRSYRPGSGWSGWLSRGGVLGSSPSAVSWGPGHVAIFVTSQRGLVWERSWGGSWLPWRLVGGPVTSAPGVVAWQRGRIDVFARGGDGAMVHRWYLRGWGPWVSRGGVLLGDGRPGAVSWGQGRLDVFVMGGVGVYRRGYQEGLGWVPVSGWERLGSPAGVTLRSGTAALSWEAGHMEVFASDTEGRIWSRRTS